MSFRLPDPKLKLLPSCSSTSLPTFGEFIFLLCYLSRTTFCILSDYYCGVFIIFSIKFTFFLTSWVFKMLDLEGDKLSAYFWDFGDYPLFLKPNLDRKLILSFPAYFVPSFELTITEYLENLLSSWGLYSSSSFESKFLNSYIFFWIKVLNFSPTLIREISFFFKSTITF